MERIPIYNAKARLSELGRLAREAGRHFIVTNRGEDMFEIGPVTHGRSQRGKRELMDELEAITAAAPRQSVDKTLSDIEHGRR